MHNRERRKILEAGKSLLGNLRIDEKLIPSLEMDLGLLAQFGPADLSLVEISKKRFPDAVIITTDDTLFRYCQRFQVPVKWFGEIIEAH